MTTLSGEKERWIMAKRTLVGLALLGVIGGARAWADDSCNGLIDITYPGAPAVSQVGDVIAVKGSLGSKMKNVVDAILAASGGEAGR